MKPMIALRNVSYSYPAEEGKSSKLVLDGVELSLEKGSFTAVLGRNGSGKSTLARHLNGILLPTGGTVYVAGIDTRSESMLLEIRRQVGMVFQNPDNQLVANVVEEDIAFAPENLGYPPEEIRRRVDQALQSVGMYELRDHAPHLLSGGQKQRIAIAGVLAMQPECVVFDEPTAMLDPQGRKDILNIIRSLQESRKVTVVLVTHHMDEAAQAERVVVMDQGRLVLDGTPREIFPQADKLRELGLEVPETTALLLALNQDGLSLPTDALTVEECACVIARALGMGENA